VRRNSPAAVTTGAKILGGGKSTYRKRKATISGGSRKTRKIHFIY
jgi:hypothetical protein